jgi:D-alanyl-D-alanine carboxypeptidase
VVVVAACGGDEASPATSSTATGSGGQSVGAGGEPSHGGTGGTGGSAALATALGASLQAALDATLDDAGAPGAVAAVQLSDGSTWLGATGLSDVAREIAMTPQGLFQIGSVTKTFVAAITLRLAAEGVLSIDDPIAEWVPDFPNATAISVRHLLSHTSGIYNYTDSDAFWDAIASDPLDSWTPEELTAIAAAEPPEFAPGEGWSYSNTNFILLGSILEAATGSDARALVETEIAAPLALTDSSLSNTNADLPPELVRGYHDGVDMTVAYDVSRAWTAGGMASSAADLARFASALLHAEVVDQPSLEQMTTPSVPSLDAGEPYGLGLMRVSTQLGESWGHGGMIWGFLSVVLHVPERDITVVALINSSSGDETLIPSALIDVLAE